MKNRNKNYKNSTKAEFKIISNVRGQYLYRRAKPRGITVNMIYKRTSFFFLLKVLDNDVRNDGIKRSVN